MALGKLGSQALAQGTPSRLGPTRRGGLGLLTVQREEQQRRQRGARGSHAGPQGAPAARPTRAGLWALPGKRGPPTRRPAAVPAAGLRPPCAPTR